MNLQTRYNLNQALQNWVYGVMQQNNITATEMEDAINNVHLSIKDAAFQECIQEIMEEQTRAAELAQRAAAQSEQISNDMSSSLGENNDLSSDLEEGEERDGRINN